MEPFFLFSPDTAFADLCKFALAHCKLHNLPTLPGDTTAAGFVTTTTTTAGIWENGQSAKRKLTSTKTDPNNTTTIKPQGPPSAGNPYCNHQGHKRGPIPAGDTIYTLGHLTKDCHAKKSNIANGGPKGGPHRPGPAKCYNCGTVGHKQQDCRKSKKDLGAKPDKKDLTCHRCGQPGHFARDCRATPGAQVLLANGTTTRQIVASHPPTTTTTTTTDAAAFAAAPAAAQPQQQPQPPPPTTTTAPTPPPGHYYKLMKMSAGVAAGTIFGLLCATNIPLTSAATGFPTAPASFATDPMYGNGTYVPDAGIDFADIAFDVADLHDGMALFTGNNPVYTSIQPMDSGATHGTIDMATVTPPPGGTPFDWSHIDPTFVRPTALAYGNHQRTQTVQAVGEYKYLRLRDGDCAEILYGPTLVTQQTSYRLQSADQHVKLHNGEIRHNAAGMAMHYPNGNVVDFIQTGGLYNVPTSCSRDHANPSILQNFTLTLPQPSTTTTPSTGLTALAAVLDGTAQQPSEHYDTTWKRMLTNIGYSHVEAGAEVELMHNWRGAESERENTDRLKHKPSRHYDIYNATWGFQGRGKTQRIATADNVALTGRDRAFNIAKAIGSSTAAPMYHPQPAITVATPHKWSRIAFDDINGMPAPFHYNYTSMLVITSSTGRTRVYFNKHDQTTDTSTAPIDRYLADSGMHRGGFRLGPEVFRSDSKSIFTSEKFKNNTATRGAINIYSAPQDGKLQNHEVEGEIRIGTSMMLSMLWSIDLAGTNLDPLRLWPWAIRHAFELKAMTPPSKAGRCPPSEYETGIPVDRSVIKTPWGTIVGVHIVADDRLKLEPHIRLGYYLGQTSGGHPDTPDVLMIDTKKIKSSRSLIFDPWPSTKIMPSTYDFGNHFGDIVHDPVDDKFVTVLDATQLPPPPPPPPPPLPTTTDAFKSYTAIAPSHLHNDAETVADDTVVDSTADAIPPTLHSPTTTAATEQYSTSINYKTKPGGRFHVGQQVEVDYTSQNDGIWKGTVVTVNNKSIEVDFGVGYAKPSIFRSNKPHTVQPSQAPTSPDGIVLAVLRDVAATTTTAFANMATAATAATTLIANFIPSTMICAALLCTAVAPNAEITSFAVHQDMFATTSDFITTKAELATPSTYTQSFALAANGSPIFEDGDPHLDVALAFGAQQQYTLSQVKEPPDAEDWLQSCKKEFEGLGQNNTWNLVRADDPLVAACDVVDMKMFFTKKCDQNGNLGKRKCRSVGRGGQATFGVGYLESNAPTPTPDAIRTLCSIAAVDDLNLTQHDFTQAFVSTDMTIKNTMPRFQKGEGGRLYEFADGTRGPDEFKDGEQGVELFGHAQKSIYGLTDPFANMNAEVVMKCKAAGFCQSSTEPLLALRAAVRLRTLFSDWRRRVACMWGRPALKKLLPCPCPCPRPKNFGGVMT